MTLYLVEAIPVLYTLTEIKHRLFSTEAKAAAWCNAEENRDYSCEVKPIEVDAV